MGRKGLYLEDLFVIPEKRGRGYGKALLKYLANLAVVRHCGRMEWICLDWNQSALNVYRSIGAIPMDEWTVQRLDESSLKQFTNKNYNYGKKEHRGKALHYADAGADAVGIRN